jgi:hypothetical protein
MSWQTELKSWMFPTVHPTTEPPRVGQKAPQTEKLKVQQDGKPTIVTFLRHCGCPCRLTSYRSGGEEVGGGKDMTKEIRPEWAFFANKF